MNARGRTWCAGPLAQLLTRVDIHYAWVAMTLTFCTILVMSAALGLPGALIRPLRREFGWSTGDISAALALRFALYGLLGPFTALLIAKFTLRGVMCCGILLVAGGMAAATWMTQLWQLTLLWGLLLGIGSGVTAAVLGAVVAGRWFEAQRGLVIGILTASTATGQLLFLPLGAWLIEHHGWRIALIPVVCASAVIAALVWLLMEDQPEQIGLRAYGRKSDAGASGAADRQAPAAPAPQWRMPFLALAEASRQPAFWMLFASFYICGLSTNGLIQTHFISLCADQGLGAIPAAAVLAMMGLFDLFGTIGSGWLSDRYDNRLLLAWYYGLRGLSLLWLPHSAFTIYGLSLFAVFYGMDWIATVPPTVKLSHQYFGPARSATLFGWIFAGHQLGAASAAFGGGWSRSLLASYSPAVYAAGAACLLASGLMLSLRGPGRTLLRTAAAG